MKKTTIVLLLAVLFAVSGIGYSGTIHPSYQVGTWRGFSTAAVSYTFDDNHVYQYTVAIPMFNEFDFNATFFLVTSWVTDWTPWQSGAAAGHEMASHTVTHARLQSAPESEYSDSQATINYYIPGNQCLTIAYPNCRSGSEATCAKYYISGRNCSGGANPPTPANFYEIKSNICGSRGTIKTLSDFISQNEKAVTAGGWQVYLLHDLDDGNGYSPLPSSTLRQSLEWLDARRSTYWVDTYLNVVKYIKQRNDVSVAEISAASTSITARITDNLDDAIYNQCLSIRRILPAGWTSASVKQNNQSISSSIVTVASTTYIQFDALPDGGDIVITKTSGDTKPPAAPTGLTATAVSSSQINLDWADNSEPDLADYKIYRDGYLIASNITSSQYSNTGLSASAQYCYTVTAVDTSGNESSESNTACAATQSGGGGGTMHVDSITVAIVYVNPVSNKAVASVVIKDDTGAAVSGATVSGTFSGGITATASAATDATGTAVLNSAAKKGLTSATFCVDNLSHTTLTYDSGPNVETCDSN